MTLLRTSQRGMTMIELMVGLLVGLAISAAVTGVLALSGRARYTALAGADVNQVASYVQMTLDRQIRSAGSGFLQNDFALGCPIQASKSGTQILPATSALPAPFASVNPGTSGLFRLAPVLIASGQTTPAVSGQPSDVLIVMSGQSGSAEAPLNFASLGTNTTVTLDSNVGLTAGTLMLLADQARSSSDTALPCLISQVTSTYVSAASGPVTLAGTYYAATINTNTLTGLSATSVVLPLGDAGSNPPLFQVIGVGGNNTLFTYDLLQIAGSTPVPMADGVFELKALYGVDVNDDGSVASNEWFAPTGTYAIANLMDGSTAAATTLSRIKAVRIGLILRTSRKEGDTVAPSSLTLFSSMSALAYTRTLSASEQAFRYVTTEFTVPVVNAVLPKLPS